MNALSSLIREHQVLTRLIDGLAGYASQLCEPHDGAADPNDLGAFARVFRGYADELHHEKEEEILQPVLSRHGFHWEEGVLADVRIEHEQERYLIEILAQASERDLAWTEEDRRSIAATALALVTFQREHLRKENYELFPEVTRRLGGDVLDELRAGFERFDSVPRHVALQAELLPLAEELIRRYAPNPRAGSALAEKAAAAAASET